MSDWRNVSLPSKSLFQSSRGVDPTPPVEIKKQIIQLEESKRKLEVELEKAKCSQNSGNPITD